MTICRKTPSETQRRGRDSNPTAGREESRNARNFEGGEDAPGQDPIPHGRSAPGSATGGAELPGEGMGLAEGLGEALRRLDAEVERVGDEKLLRAMTEVWECWGRKA